MFSVSVYIRSSENEIISDLKSTNINRKFECRRTCQNIKKKLLGRKHFAFLHFSIAFGGINPQYHLCVLNAHSI